MSSCMEGAPFVPHEGFCGGGPTTKVGPFRVSEAIGVESWEGAGALWLCRAGGDVMRTNKRGVLGGVAVAGVVWMCGVGGASARSFVQLDKETTGLAFRFLWVESASPDQRATLLRYRFPAGTAYDSQTVRRSVSLSAGTRQKTDGIGNVSLAQDGPLLVSQQTPLLLGFVADVRIHRRAFKVVDPNDIPLRPRPQSPEILAYLKDEAEYQIQSKEVQSTISQLFSPRAGPLERATKIWNFVHNHMRYARPLRPNTGLEVLQWKKGFCGEYTRLTATLSRASGLAARETHAFGFFVKGPQPNDHAWADVYLPGVGWTPLQPQEKLPRDGRYPLSYFRYLVVYRGVAFKSEHRVVEGNNLIQWTPSGVGYFVELLSASARAQVLALAQKIARDGHGPQAEQLLTATRRVPPKAEAVLLWMLGASANEVVGLKALRRLLSVVQSEGLELARFRSQSPVLVRHRMDRLLGKGGAPLTAHRFHGHRYQVYGEAMPWFAAQKYCDLLGGHLVTIGSQAEQRLVGKLARTLDRGRRIWVGMARSSPRAPWRWVTGEPVGYKLWSRGMPDPTRKDWSRVRPSKRSPAPNVVRLSYAGKWVDSDGQERRGFVCEWPR